MEGDRTKTTRKVEQFYLKLLSSQRKTRTCWEHMRRRSLVETILKDQNRVFEICVPGKPGHEFGLCLRC